MSNPKVLQIIKPDDWHVHLREGKLLQCVIQSTSRVFGRCIVMPNLIRPITTSVLCENYKKQIEALVKYDNFLPLFPCYLTDNVDLVDFEFSLKNNIFVGAKLYPVNVTTNSKYGVTNIEKIYPALELLDKYNKPLLVHGEKISKNISLFDREKFFIDDELTKLIKKFPSLKIVLEHVSSKYGADFVAQTDNLAGTITPHHLLLTKKDVFQEKINYHHYCMPIVKDEKDLVSLRNYACSGSDKFFIGTDSAPHEFHEKEINKNIKPGIFSAPCAMELYTDIFEQENSLENLEKFCSLNGPKFYNLPPNNEKIRIIRDKYIVEEFTVYDDIRIKNFFNGKKINWRIELQ
jgi:dihydroorotase